MERKVVWCTLLLPIVLQVLPAGVEAARILDRCTLAREMDALGVPRSHLARWTFIADAVSSYRTDAISEPNLDKSRNYGLFQFSNRYWCQSTPGIKSKNLCEVDCVELVKDNIKATVDCALKVLGLEGWEPWPSLNDFDELWSVEDCFKDSSTVNNTRTTESQSGGMFSVDASMGLAHSYASKQEF